MFMKFENKNNGKSDKNSLTPPGSDQRRRVLFFGLVLIPLLAMWLFPLLNTTQADVIPFSLFLEQVEGRNVRDLQGTGGDNFR
jgi:hypothetical protein